MFIRIILINGLKRYKNYREQLKRLSQVKESFRSSRKICQNQKIILMQIGRKEDELKKAKQIVNQQYKKNRFIHADLYYYIKKNQGIRLQIITYRPQNTHWLHYPLFIFIFSYYQSFAFLIILIQYIENLFPFILFYLDTKNHIYYSITPPLFLTIHKNDLFFYNHFLSSLQVFFTSQGPILYYRESNIAFLKKLLGGLYFLYKGLAMDRSQVG